MSIYVNTDVELNQYNVGIDLGVAGYHDIEVDIEIDDFEVELKLEDIASQLCRDSLETIMGEMDKEEVANAIIGVYSKVMSTVVDEACSEGLGELIRYIAKKRPEDMLQAISDSTSLKYSLLEEAQDEAWKDDKLYGFFVAASKSTNPKQERLDV